MADDRNDKELVDARQGTDAAFIKKRKDRSRRIVEKITKRRELEPSTFTANA